MASVTKWKFFGRVFPDVPPIWLDLPHHTGTSSLGFAFELQGTVRHSKVVATVTQIGDVDLETLRNTVVHDLQISLDLVGTVIGAGLEVMIESAANDLGGSWFFDGYIPVLRQDKSVPLSAELLDAIGMNPPAQLMLADFRSAMRVPAQTGFHCYRAVESITHYLRQSDDNKNAAWKRLQADLHVSPEVTRQLEAYAKGPRHGEAGQITSEQRAALLTITRVIVDRYISYLLGAARPLDESKFPLLKWRGPVVDQAKADSSQPD
jgi:hypothetical protein